MFLRTLIQRKGDREYRYLKVLESYREAGCIRQRTLLNFGNVEGWPAERLNRLIRLLQALVGEPTGPDVKDVQVVSAQDYGPGLALEAVWRRLGMPELIGAALGRRHPEFPVASAIEAMVLNRLVDPKSKLGVIRWIRGHYCAGLEGEALSVQHLYRALEYLTEAQEALETAIYGRVSDLFTLEVSLVFYDITSSYFEGSHCPLGKRGYSRDHRPDLCQVELGLLVNPEGIPICHRVFAGNRKDVTTVPEIVASLQQRFRIGQVVFVGDGGMVGPGTMAALEAAHYPYIFAQRLRRNAVLAPRLAALPAVESFETVRANLLVTELAPISAGRRLIACYNPVRAEQEQRDREAKLARVEAYLEGFRQPRRRGQSKQPQAVEAQIQAYLDARHVSQFFECRYHGDGDLRCRRKAEVIAQEARLDGLRILETTSTLAAAEVASAYRTLAQVEDSFREIKSFVRIRPIRHYQEVRVKGHIAVCVLALLMERLMEQALRRAGVELTAQAALETLAELKLVTLQLDGERVRRSTHPTKLQGQILAALGMADIPQLLPAS
jgi:transposase